MKKILLSFLTFLIFFYSIVPNFLIARAQEATAPPEGSWYNQGFDQWYNKVYDENTSPAGEIFGERYTAAQVQWVIYSLFAFILNASLGNSSTSQKAVACFITNSGNIETCGAILQELFDQTTDNTGFVAPEEDKNLLQLVFAEKPFSGIGYVKTKLNNFKLIPEAQAQTLGFGFSALAPVQDMWRASRDVAFGLFVLVAIIFAFMIMFRVKISPQVIITIQSAIPKIIISLVLVTFSYAIAGFLIDLMYVVIGLFSLIIPQFSPGSITPPQAFNLLTGVTRSGDQGGVLGIIGFSLVYIAIFVITFLIVLSQSLFGILQVLSFLGVGFMTGIGTLLFIPLIIIAVIICLWNSIKTWWALIKAFVNILLLTIFAPLQIVSGTLIPNFGFGSWVRSFASNLAVFVTTGLLMIMSFIFLSHAWHSTGVGLDVDFFSRLFLGSLSPSNISISEYWPPFLGTSNSQAMIGFVYLGASFVLFTLIPKATEIVQGFISGKQFAYGTAIGETFGFVNLGPIQAARKEFSEASAANLLKIAGSIASRVAPGTGTGARLTKLGERARIE